MTIAKSWSVPRCKSRVAQLRLQFVTCVRLRSAHTITRSLSGCGFSHKRPPSCDDPSLSNIEGRFENTVNTLAVTIRREYPTQNYKC
jgi:hypothetical protein